MKNALLAAIATLLASAAFAQPRAHVDCTPAPRDELAYDCTLLLTRKEGTPLDGATVAVGADMPSMPMAHNVKPVRAAPTGTPGEYRLRLELEMHGEWALKLRLSGTLNDLLVVHLDFDPRGVAPSQPRKR